MDNEGDYDVNVGGEFLTLDDCGCYDTHNSEAAARKAAEDVATRYSTTRKVYKLVEVASVTGEKVVRWSDKKAARKPRKAVKKSVKAKRK